MKKDKPVMVSGGVSLSTALFLIFLVLKLTGNIAWSWWWITCPLWGPTGILVLILIIALIGMLLT